MIFPIYKFIGILGMIFVSLGVLVDQVEKANLFYIIGGILLEIYSLYLRDFIFIVLQLVFIASAIYEYYQHKNQ